MRGIYGKTPAQRFKSLGGKVNQLQMLTWLTVNTPSAVGLTLAVDAFFFFFPAGSYQQRSVLTSGDGRWWEQQSPTAVVALFLLKEECCPLI